MTPLALILAIAIGFVLGLLGAGGSILAVPARLSVARCRWPPAWRSAWRPPPAR